MKMESLFSQELDQTEKMEYTQLVLSRLKKNNNNKLLQYNKYLIITTEKWCYGKKFKQQETLNSTSLILNVAPHDKVS